MKERLNKVAKILIITTLILVLLPLINNEANVIKESGNYTSAIKSMASIIPFLYIMCGILAVISIIYSGVEVIKYLRWRTFGNRLKEAYTAKFGGVNPQFNEAVDQHIRIVETLSKGTEINTKKMAEEWLKRMAHLVEVKFVIPEEEYLSETKKTELINSDIHSEKS